MKNHRRHIAHYFPSRSWGGAEIYAFELARDQHRRGMTVTVWSYEDSHITRACREAGIAVETRSVESSFAWRARKELRACVEASGFTHLFLHSSDAVNAFGGLRIKNVTLIYYVHMWVKHRKKDPIHWWKYRTLNYIVVAGARAEAAVKRCLPVKKNKIVIIPYAIDLALTKNLNTTRASWNLATDAIVLGLFARIDPQKGQMEFLNALAQILRTRSSHVVGLVVGDATYGEDEPARYGKKIEARILEDDLKGSVKKYPFRSDFRELLKECDVLVAPSYHESYALILLHAFSLGVPVLSTESGGTPDLVTPDRGWLVAPQSTSDLAAKIQDLLQAPDEIRKKGQNAKSYVTSHHTFDAVNQRFEELIFLK